MDQTIIDRLDQARKQLIDAAQNPQNSWKLFTLSNVSIDGFPSSRYVVLRDVSFDEKVEIVFFTDNRSQKVDDLIDMPAVSLCFFDRETGVQLILKGQAQLGNQNEVSKAYWDKTSWHSLKCYYMKDKPNTPLHAPFILHSNEISEEEAYQHFTVVTCTISAGDLLHLSKTGNERILFKTEASNFTEAFWAVP